MFTALQKSVVTDGGEVGATRKTHQAKVEGGGVVGGIAANRTMKDKSRHMRLQKSRPDTPILSEPGIRVLLPVLNSSGETP
jgi:hypothetical protein